jgi:pimeloyl-ACP methyl ester carboxylesterase
MSKLIPFLFAILAVTSLAHFKSPIDHNLRGPSKSIASYPDFPHFVQSLGYPCETHTVTTEDGYILTMFRVQSKNQTTMKSNLPVVMLQHGFTDSGDTWVIDDENDAPGLRLANEGYDVWVGNSRGTKYCLSHVKMNSTDPLFWQFSWQNMSHYDIPASFEYIHRETNQNISYIGHSQGTTIMFAALSEREPSVMKYLNKFVALAPVAWVQHIKSGPMWLMAHSTLANLLASHGINQFLPANFRESEMGHLFCAVFASECANFLKFLVGADPTYDNSKQFNLILEHEPGGTSVMDAMHWRQQVLSARFCKYDYGIDGNQQHYGQPSPPDYNVSNINVPVYLFLGKEDSLVDTRDTQMLLDNLKGSPHVQYKYYPAGHITYIWSKDISFYFQDLLDILDGKDSVKVEY